MLERLSQWQFGILEYVEHLSVVLEHEREQLSNAKASGDVKEMLQEQRCRTSMLSRSTARPQRPAAYASALALPAVSGTLQGDNWKPVFMAASSTEELLSWSP